MKISIADLEVFYRVGVPDAARAQPQRLLKFGEGREWKLIEKLAADIADLVLSEFKPQSVTVEVKKFVIPQARHVAVSLTRAG